MPPRDVDAVCQKNICCARIILHNKKVVTGRIYKLDMAWGFFSKRKSIFSTGWAPYKSPPCLFLPVLKKFFYESYSGALYASNIQQCIGNCANNQWKNMRDKLKQLFFQAEDYLEDGEYALAIKTYTAALKEAKKGDEEEFLALNYLAMAYDDIDNEKKAIETFRATQQVAKSLYGDTSAQYALALSNEGMVSCNRGKLKKGEPLLDSAVALLRASTIEQSAILDRAVHSNVYEVYASAADCKAKLGNVSAAIELMQSALKAAKAGFDAGHPARMQTAFELTALLHSVGRSQEAEALSLFELACGGSADEMGLGLMKAMMMAEANISAMLQGSGAEPLVSNVVSLFGEQKKSDLAAKTGHLVDPPHAYQLKITLKRVKPATWRRIAVPSHISLASLHGCIQDAMGWTDSHLHEFRIRGNSFGDTDQMPDANDEYDYKIADFNFAVGTKFQYEYDFGDSWEHSITIEKLLDEAAYEATDLFIAGKGACPPEDCGGPYGFTCLLQALQDPNVKRKSLPDWVLEYDPQALPDCFPEKKTKSRAKAKKIPALSARP